MSKRTRKILIVEPNPDLLEMLVASLTRRFDARITSVADAESALDIEICDPHDLIIASLDLAGTSGLELAAHMSALSARPIVLIGDCPTTDQVIEAMRLGVRDVFRKPFSMTLLLDTVNRILRGQELRRQHAAKYRRMRELVRRVIRERKQLNQRVELVCRDLVGAQRRLVDRFVRRSGTQAKSA